MAIAAYSNPENRTRSVSLVRLAINLGFSLGPAIGGVVAMRLGYKWLFIIDSISSFAAAIMLMIYLPRKNPDKLITGDNDKKVKSKSAYHDAFFLAFILLVALYGTSFFQMFASIPQYFSTVSHYSEDTIGYLLALNGFLVVVIEMPLIFYMEKSKKLFSFIVAGALCLPVSFIILKSSGGLLLLAVIYTFVITMSEIFAMPFMMNFVLSKAPSDRQGQYAALYSIAYGIAIIGAPAIGLGIAEHWGFDTMFYFFIVVSLITALGFMLLGKRRKVNN